MRFRKYSVNEDFFKVWSNDMSYILGFIFADGSLSKSGFEISLSEKDIIILEYIKKCLNADQKIERFSRIKNEITYNVVRLRINSIKILKDLVDLYGLHNNKTTTASIFFDIPKEFVGDFIRGFFDGDGWVTNRRNSVESGMCTASEKLIKELHVLCGNLGFIRSRDPKYKKGAKLILYSIEMSVNDSIKLRELMYKNNNCFCLERKREKFYDFHTINEIFWTPEQEIFIKNNKDFSIEELSIKLNKSVSSIKNKKFKMGLSENHSENYGWTKEQEKILYLSDDIDLISKTLNKSKTSIYTRLRKLGLSKNKKTDWSNEDELYLIQNFNLSRKYLSEKLNKPENSIKYKLKLLRRDGKIPKPESTGRPRR